MGAILSGCSRDCGVDFHLMTAGRAHALWTRQITKQESVTKL